jgi:hypothetical protein
MLPASIILSRNQVDGIIMFRELNGSNVEFAYILSVEGSTGECSAAAWNAE